MLALSYVFGSVLWKIIGLCSFGRCFRLFAGQVYYSKYLIQCRFKWPLLWGWFGSTAKASFFWDLSEMLQYPAWLGVEHTPALCDLRTSKVQRASSSACFQHSQQQDPEDPCSPAHTAKALSPWLFFLAGVFSPSQLLKASTFLNFNFYLHSTLQ